MGMAASQVRLLQLTTRKNDIGWQLENLSMQKTSLSRDMQRVTKNYQNALSTKKLKMSNNSGVTYMDLSYSNLMRPGNANQNKPYLITNNDGKVVIDSKYLKYAEMISADGKAGGDWTTNRTKILASLTGISAETIENANSTSAAREAAEANRSALKDEGDKLEEPISKDTASKFFSHANKVNANGVSYDIGKLYDNTSAWQDLGSNAATAKSSLTSLLNGVAENMKYYLTDSDYESLKTACDNYIEDNGHYFGGDSDADKQGLESGVAGIKKDGSNYKVNLSTILNTVLGAYESNTAKAGQESYTTNAYGTKVYYTRDQNSTAWQNWKTQHDDWQSRYDAAQAAYKAAVNTDNQVLTSEQESNIKFYDQIFSAIAEKGWVQNDSVEDNDYLNQMLQNNMYYITTMSEDTDEKGKQYYVYDESIASNVDNIFSVNDSDYQNEALTEYEYEKSIISEKESRIDTRMKNLETEQSAINTMIKGIETVKNDNTERTMNIFA